MLSLQQYLCLSETVETRLGLCIFYWEKICVANEWLETENNGKYKDNNNMENLPFRTHFQSRHKGSTNLMTNSSSVLGLEPLEIIVTKATCLGACGWDVIHLNCIVDEWSATNQRCVSRQWYSHAHHQQVQPAWRCVNSSSSFQIWSTQTHMPGKVSLWTIWAVLFSLMWLNIKFNYHQKQRSYLGARPPGSRLLSRGRQAQAVTPRLLRANQQFSLKSVSWYVLIWF